jgi:hypothetical protein
MRALFNFGYERTLKGETWRNFAELVEDELATGLPD